MKKNILAIDYGAKHLGLAISLDGAMALGFKTVQNDDFSGGYTYAIKKIVKENQIEAIIVGIPESKSHGEKQRSEILKFAVKLSKQLPEVEVKTFNEDLTTKMAQRYAQKDKDHQEAARIILEDWMKGEKRAS